MKLFLKILTAIFLITTAYSICSIGEVIYKTTKITESDIKPDIFRIENKFDDLKSKFHDIQTLIKNSHPLREVQKKLRQIIAEHEFVNDEFYDKALKWTEDEREQVYKVYDEVNELSIVTEKMLDQYRAELMKKTTKK